MGRDGAYDYVEHVTVSDVVFTGATNGARIKTWQVKLILNILIRSNLINFNNIQY